MKRSQAEAKLSRLFDSVEWAEHGDPARVSTGWLKLERELTLAGRSGRTQRWMMPLVFSGMTFVVGVVVGAQYFAEPASTAALSVAAERVGAADRAPAPRVVPEVTPPQPERVDEPDEKSRGRLRVVTPKAQSVDTPTNVEEDLPSELEVIEVASAAPLGPEVPAEAPNPEWQRLADDGEYTAAWLALEQTGGFEQALAGVTADRLMLLVDMARAVGQRPRAILALQRVIDVYPTDPLAPMAAWTLGNMLERAGDSAGSARAFAKYRALSPQGDFAEDALVRQIRAAAEQGNVALLDQLAVQYQATFPSGRHLQEITQQRARFANKAEELDESDEDESLDDDDSVALEVPDEPAPSEDE